MFKNILAVRYVFLIAVIFTFINSIFFIIGGAMECIKGYQIFLEHGMSEEHRPGMYLLKGLELFLVSMVFMIFALAILRLFIVYHAPDEHVPAWLNISGFKDLKILLWETILVTLVVFSLTKIATAGVLNWSTLILPGMIFLLTGSLFLMKKSSSKDEGH
jgi:uncharacterized membrane protein YqhA